MCAVLLSGCSNAKTFRGFDLSAAPDARLIAVPPVALTEKRGCGFAALSSVAMYHGVGAKALLAPAIRERFVGRALSAQDLVEMSKALGLGAYGYSGTVEDLTSNLRKGRPAIVMLDGPPRGGYPPPFGLTLTLAKAIVAGAHWVVVVGVEPGGFVVYDPLGGYFVMTSKALDRSWQKRSRVCVLVTREKTGPDAKASPGPK